MTTTLTRNDFSDEFADAHFRYLGHIAKMRGSIVSLRDKITRFRAGDRVYIKEMMISANPPMWREPKGPFIVGDVVFCGTTFKHVRAYLAHPNGHHAGSAPVDLLRT